MISLDFVMSKEHRIPLRKIMCLTKDCYKKLSKVWMVRVKPLSDHCDKCSCQYAALLVFFFVFAIVHLRRQLCTNQREKKDALGRTDTNLAK